MSIRQRPGDRRDPGAVRPRASAAAAPIPRTRPDSLRRGPDLAKGATFDELVAGAAQRLRGVVLIGQDRALIGEALRRHAPDVPVIEAAAGQTGAMAMAEVVRAAASLAERGDTVLLAPACASMDMFTNYGERGDLFAAAVRELAE